MELDGLYTNDTSIWVLLYLILMDKIVDLIVLIGFQIWELVNNPTMDTNSRTAVDGRTSDLRISGR